MLPSYSIGKVLSIFLIEPADKGFACGAFMIALSLVHRCFAMNPTLACEEVMVLPGSLTFFARWIVRLAQKKRSILI